MPKRPSRSLNHTTNTIYDTPALHKSTGQTQPSQTHLALSVSHVEPSESLLLACLSE